MATSGRGKPSLLLTACLLFSSLGVEAGEIWPEFRGPHGDGQARESNPPVTWDESTNVRWKTPIHGKGWSSPVVDQDQIWLTTATEDGRRMSVVCLARETGTILHDRVVFQNSDPQFCHPTNSYASPTPVLQGDRLYVHFGSYGTACLDTRTARTLWERRDLPCDHFRGPGSSPILFEGGLYVAFDGFDQQYQIALDAETGATLWKRDRQIDYGSDDGDFRKAYCTGSVFPIDGRPQLVSPSAAETIAYDPDTGDELWRFRHGGMNTATRPLFAHGLVYVTTGDAVGAQKPSLVAIRPTGHGRLGVEHVAWALDQGAPKRSSPILAGEYLFFVGDEGVATCLNAKTGDVIWRKRLGGTYRASPVCASNRIYFFNLEGRATVIRATPSFELLAENELENGCQASAAIVDDALIVRTTAHLYCIE